MNYYEHHIGDFLKKTVHLTAIEEGIYRRLLDRYYTTEAPLPLDFREVCKLARASSKPERDAVRDILRDFFTEEIDGYHQGRADQEIARFKDKQAKAKRSAEARWNAQRSPSEGNANAYADAHANASDEGMRTHCEGNAPRARPQTPDTNHHTQYMETHTGAPTAPARVSQATAVCVALRAEGIASVNPGHPDLQALLDRGCEVQTFVNAARTARDKGKGFAYVLGIVKGQLNDAEQLAQAPRAPPGATRSRPPTRADQREATMAALTGRNRERTDHADPAGSPAIDVDARLVG